MTVRQDLERSIAMAEASKGSYMLFATESDDQKAKQVFQDMASDMERHVTILKSRVDYLDQYNQLNAGEDQSGDSKDKKKQNGGSGNKNGGN